MPDSDFDPQAVLDALAARPDGAAALAIGGARVAAVGGFVRDVLIGRDPRELDLVAEGDLGEITAQLGGDVQRHPQFLAAHVTRDGWAIEVTQARSETYAQPGALPLVATSTLEQDLARRDFSVNALAVTLDGGELIAPPGALEDLAARRLRVLHERSFIDDPTRVMRLYRYAHRLGFEIDPDTERLADAATLDTLSGARIAGELRLALREPDPLAPLAELVGKLPIVVDRQLVDAALRLAPADADRELVILAALLREGVDQAWLTSLELTAHEREVIEAAAHAGELAIALAAASAPSMIRDAVRGVPLEVIAIAGALGPSESARRWLDELRHVRLEIRGDDLLAAGIPAGPEVGARLERTLRLKLDGKIDVGRRGELASAIEGAS